MNSLDELEERIKRLSVSSTDTLDQRILSAASAALENPPSTLLDAQLSSVWRIIMRNKWAKLAAALLVAATLGTITFHRQVATVAYALEETLEANLGLRYTHIRIEPAGEGLREAWAEFGDDGKLLRLRMYFPKTKDGEKEVVWQEGKAEVWFKTKGHILVIHEKKMAEKISKELASFDPKAVIEQLHEAEASGKVEIETQKPSKEGDPITLLVSFNDSPNQQGIYQINPQTKLVEQFEKYRLVDGKRELLLRIEYLEYNQKIPPGTFVLDVPDDLMRVDWTTQEVGLSQGDLTNDQIAVKVAREFFEALIAKDYGKAGRILSGMPASRVEEAFGKMEFLRIISVGDATPYSDERPRILQVPCEVEFRMDGQTHTKKFKPNIRARAIEGQTARWFIDGGI